MPHLQHLLQKMHLTSGMRHLAIFLFLGLCAIAACRDDAPVSNTRTYRMGFQNYGPRPEFNITIQSLLLWSQHADAAIITTEVPWDSIYAGKSIQQYVINNYSGVVKYYREQNFKLWIYIDPANGLNRATDAEALVKRGKSISQPDVQKLYRRFVVVMDSILHPEHLGLALETNLIRLASSASIYNGVKKAANDAVTDVRVVDKDVKLSVSVQADIAWGNTTNTNTYVGIAQDFIDFPFVQELGISSYPYFYLDDPNKLPLDYYSKLVEGKSMSIFISEGGWNSQSFTGPDGNMIKGSQDIQQKYIRRQTQLLDRAKAIAVFQLTPTDLDVSFFPPGVDPTINFFIYLGLWDKELNSKLALTEWDANFKKNLK